MARIREEKWEDCRADITSWLPTETYEQIIDNLRVKHCLEPKKHQLEYRLRKWGLWKNTPSDVQLKALAKADERQGKPTEILIESQHIPLKKLKKTARAVKLTQKRKAEQKTFGQCTQKTSGQKRQKRTGTAVDSIAGKNQEPYPSSPDNIIVRTPPALGHPIASPLSQMDLRRIPPSQTPIDVFDPWFECKLLLKAEMIVIPLLDNAALYEQPVLSQPYGRAVFDQNDPEESASAISMELTSSMLNLASPALSQLQFLIARLTHEGYIERTDRFPSIFKSTAQFQLLRSFVYLGSNNLLPDVVMDMLLEWISTHNLLWVIESLIGSQLPSAAIFCSQVFNRAVATRNTNTVRVMLAKGVDPNLESRCNGYQHFFYRTESPLQVAIQNEDTAMVHILLKYGAKVNNCNAMSSSDGGRSARTHLDIASDGPRISLTIMELLVRHHADTNMPIPSLFGLTTVLNRALVLNEIEVVKMLLVSGDASVDNHQGGNSISALQTASRYCDSETVQLIIEAGADVNIPIGSGYNVAKEVAMATSNYGFLVTPLQYAAKRDDIAVAKLLLAEKAFVDGFEFNELLPRGHMMAGLDDSGNHDFGAIEDIDAQASRDTFKYYIEDCLGKEEEDISPLLHEISLYSPLQAAAANKNLAMVQLLLEHDCTINMMGGLGTALQIACMQRGNMEIVKLLIEKGADINSPAHARYGRTALQAAILSGDLEVADYLLLHNADVQSPPSSVLGRTPLQAAAKMGYTQLASKLIERGADVNEETSMYGETCLHLAARSGNMELVCLCLKHGAHVNKPSEARAWSYTILCYAICSGSHEIVKMLLHNGANTSDEGAEPDFFGYINVAVEFCRRETVELLLRKGADPNQTDEEGRTPLEYAVGHSSLEIVQLLLDFEANLNKISSSASSILTNAITRNDEDLARMLIANGAEVNPPDDYSELIPLSAAIRVGNFSIVRMLVAEKANVHGQYGIDGLMEAIEAGSTDMVQFLFSLGLTAKHIDVDDLYPQLPLTRAINRGNPGIIDVLLGHDTGFYFRDVGALAAAVKGGNFRLIQRLLGLRTEAVDQRAYDAALDSAVLRGNITVIEALIAAGADVNASSSSYCLQTGFNGVIGIESLDLFRLVRQNRADVNPSEIREFIHHTPLQCAVQTGNTVIVKLLLSHGAKVNTPGAKHDADTALEQAAKMGRLDFVDLMLQHDRDPATLEQRIKSAAELARWNGHPLVARYMEDWQKNGSVANST